MISAGKTGVPPIIPGAVNWTVPYASLGDGMTRYRPFMAGGDGVRRQPSAELLRLTQEASFADEFIRGQNGGMGNPHFVIEGSQSAPVRHRHFRPDVLIATPFRFGFGKSDKAPKPKIDQIREAFHDYCSAIFGKDNAVKKLAALLSESIDFYLLSTLLLTLTVEKQDELLGRLDEGPRKKAQRFLSLTINEIPKRLERIRRIVAEEKDVGRITGTGFFFPNAQGLGAAQLYHKDVMFLINILAYNTQLVAELKEAEIILIKKIADIQKTLQEEADRANTYIGGSGGRFRATRFLGSGGMAAVYQGTNFAGAPVAVKIFRPPAEPDKAEYKSFLDRFRYEAHILTNLAHPNIIRGYDYGNTDGKVFIIMEYIDGDSLDKLVGKFTPQEVADIGIHVSLALAYALERGVVHRDIKPSNIIKENKTGAIKVGDFGIAKILNARTSLTSTGQLPGTLNYIAPEAISEVPSEQIHLLDIYSLGITLYELLAGKVPFDFKREIQLWAGYASGTDYKLERPTNVPDELWRIIKKMIAFKPDERYQNYGELIADLNRYLEAPDGLQDSTVIAVEEHDILRSGDFITSSEPTVIAETEGLLAIVGRLCRSPKSVSREELMKLRGGAQRILMEYGKLPEPPSQIIKLANFIVDRIDELVR